VLTVDGVEMLEVRAAAVYVGRTPETVRRWVWSGRVPSIRRGNRLLIARPALDAAAGRDGPGRNLGGASAGSPGPTASAPTLAAWAASLPSSRGTAGPSATTAADLISDERWSDDHGR